MSHILVVPTNRAWESPLEPLSAELEAFPELTFVLLDSSPDPEPNAARVGELPRARHLTLPWLLDFCLAVGGSLSASLQPGPVANYGKVANLVALVGAALGATTLSRRDADELLVARAEGGWWFPVEREVALLTGPEAPYLAGTVHFGDCDCDVDRIYRTGGSELMAELGRLLGLELDFADPAVKAALKHPPPARMEDWARVAPGQSVYPGLCTDRGLFRHLPVAPAEETPDVDNLPVALALGAGWALGAHGRVLEHRHPPGRDDSVYWWRLARAIDYNALYAPVFQAVRQERPQGPEELARLVGSAPRAEDRAPRLELQERFAAFLSRLYPERDLAARIESEKEDCLAAVDEGAARHLELLSRWPELIATAARHSP
ncbi:MAG: hypothetical protein AMXMBFR33_09210 [Candidatus Xenobia bacterium]